MKNIKIIAVVVFWLSLVSFLVWCFVNSPEDIVYDYCEKVEAEKPDKIENAISNVVYDLKKRDFVPVYLEVKWYPSFKTYIIYTRGIDKTKLGKYEP